MRRRVDLGERSAGKSDEFFRKTVICRLICTSPPLAGFALRDYGASPCRHSGIFDSQSGIAGLRLISQEFTDAERLDYCTCHAIR